MAIRNPYPIPTDDETKTSTRFATYLAAEDKSLLMGLRPARGTAQAVVNTLIQNFCNDLRDLGLTYYRADADDILTVLCERRALTDTQIARLRRTSVGVSQPVPAWLRNVGGSSNLRKGSKDDKIVPSNIKSKVTSGVGRTRKGSSKKTTNK